MSGRLSIGISVAAVLAEEKRVTERLVGEVLEW